MPMTKTEPVDVVVPGDKSISHRALMFGALSTGRTRVRNILDSEDVQSTARVLRALGAPIPALSDDVSFDGAGLRGLRASAEVLDCGNSGTTVRLMMGIMAGYAFPTRFDGDESLRSRPMRRVTEPLMRMGARVTELGQPDRLPVQLEGGRLREIDFDNPRSSAQVKSAVLLAALTGGVPAAVSEPVHSRDHTERLLEAAGVPIRTVIDGHAIRVEIEPAESMRALELTVPGDFSSAAFFIGRGLLGNTPIRIANVDVNSTRTGLLDVIRRMHGAVHVTNRRETGHEPAADLIVEPSRLTGTHVEGTEIPHMVDEVPILAVMAARAEGETVIRGAGELRVKETDRLRALAENLRAVGASVDETEDGLVIQGSDRALRGRVKTFGDHRIAMAFGVLGSLEGNEIVMDDVGCVAVSFPTFWKQLEGCAR